VGLSGKDGGLLRAHKYEDEESGADWGLVGEVEKVNVDVLHTLGSRASCRL
jgi:acetylglutamate kinase